MRKIVALASLYQPMEFLVNRIRNLRQCDMSQVTVYWADCSPEATWKEVERAIKIECSFDYRVAHFKERKTLYWTWNWIIERVREEGGAEYLCNANVDDILHPEYFKKVPAFLDAHQETLIVSVPWLITKQKGQIWPPNYENHYAADPQKTMGHFPMWRLAAHDSVGLFHPQMLAIGDSHFWTQIRTKHGLGAMAAIEEYLGCYLAHENNLYNVSRGPDGISGEGHDRGIMRKEGMDA